MIGGLDPLRPGPLYLFTSARCFANGFIHATAGVSQIQPTDRQSQLSSDMLKFLFDWWDHHPDSYWLMVAGPTLLLFAWALIPIRESLRRQPDKVKSWIWSGLVVFLFLFAWRWPWLLSAHGLNPDESQHVAGALTLAVDPVFFRSVDGATSGPLNFFATLPLALTVGQIDYFTVRLTGLFLVWGSLLLGYQTARALTGAAVARLGLLPAAMFFATTDDWDFIHYSTEHLPVFLFCLTLWLLVRAKAAQHPRGWLVAAGLAAGLSPWAKLQMGPITAGLIGFALWQIAIRAASPKARMSHALALGLPTLAPTALALALLAMGGLTGVALQRYVLQVFVYVEDGGPYLDNLAKLGELIRISGTFPFFALGPLLMIILAGLVTVIKRRGRFHSLYTAGAALTGIGVFCVMLPGRPFQHYLLLLIAPLTLWGLAGLHDLWTSTDNRRWQVGLAGLVFLFGGLIPLGHRLSKPVPFMFGSFTEHWRHPRSGAANLVHHLTRPDDRISVWGYGPEVHAESGRAQATRDTDTFWLIGPPSSHRETYRTTHLADFMRNQPAVFVDSVGPDSFFYRDRLLQGHETFPALAGHITSQYTQVADLTPFRLYLRNDLFDERRLTAADLQTIVGKGRMERPLAASPSSITPPDARTERVGRQWVQMLLPPARMTWELTGNERVARIHYGFHPQAVAARSGDGARIIVEIESPGGPARPVFTHFVQPLVNPAERKPLSATLDLPPFPSGSLLVVRTDVGPQGDNAWDWLYLASLEFRKSPFPTAAQYPGFGRIPESATAATAYHVDEPEGRLLMQHAPARMVFPLSGLERQLSFSFGFTPGAYTGEGRTDGAVFRVERHRAGTGPVLLFERRLHPVAAPADQGRQAAAFDLVDILPDDRLHVIIDPGGNDSWDWTYVTDLLLE